MSLGWKLNLCRLPASCQYKIFTVFNRRLPAGGLLSVWQLRKEAAEIQSQLQCSWPIPQQLLHQAGAGAEGLWAGRQRLSSPLETSPASALEQPLVLMMLATICYGEPSTRGVTQVNWEGLGRGQKRDGLVQEWCQSSKHPQEHGCAKKGVCVWGELNGKQKNIGTFEIAKRAFFNLISSTEENEQQQ